MNYSITKEALNKWRKYADDLEEVSNKVKSSWWSINRKKHLRDTAKVINQNVNEFTNKYFNYNE